MALRSNHVTNASNSADRTIRKLFATFFRRRKGLHCWWKKLLSLARADAGGESLEIRRLELGETVRQVALDWHGVMTAHRLQFTENLTTREVPIAGDRTAMCRLLNILLDNAVKYTPQPGSVDLQLDTDGEKARISVVDTGIGISEEDRSRIFERFYRADKARSRESGGLVLDCQSPTGS